MLRMAKKIVFMSLAVFYSSILLAGDIGVKGNVTATNFIGNGAGLAGVVKIEDDPQVGVLATDKWCKADSSGAVIQCNQNRPLMAEVDPVIDTLTPDKWCKADSGGKVIQCDQDAPPPPITFQLWVPKTGQTECWNEKGASRLCATTGEDGEYKMGGRTIEPADWKEWHPAFRANPRFTDNGDGTVTDNLTGLVWLKRANCIADNSGFDNDGTGDDGQVTWQHGLDFVKGMNALKYNCGDTSNHGDHQTDWRLPNFNELLSLTDPSQTNPALSSGHPFSGVVTSYYWSSTTYAANTTYAWIVYLGNGYVGNDGKTYSYYVWPVRAGQ